MLWFDLMFDVQVLRHRGAPVLPEAVLASIAAYYRRVTTDAAPMNRMVGVAMGVAVGGSLYQLFHAPSWSALLAVLLSGLAVGLAGARVVPAAVRLGARTDTPERQTDLARSICREHLVCLACIAVFLALQLRAAM